ncbi:MAG: NUDIX domain-containing protein [Betaproteobacteria bacterium]|nr:NUDIX domain-containing protein [Betaproteobacteria bacterium]
MTMPSPQPASTVTLVRDTTGGLEVLMLQRNFTLGFMPGVHVFPGGALDAADSAPELHALCVGIEDASASRALGVARGGLAYWVAAIREAFEEAGILLAYEPGGDLLSMSGETADRYVAHRSALDERRADFAEFVRNEGLRLATDRLFYFGHWITPAGAPRRYDTRFFLAVAPQGQEARQDNRETIAHVWVRPQEALELCAREALRMRFPTIKTLERFAACSTTAALIAEIASSTPVQALLPRVTPDGRRVLPGDPGYDEAGA